jgi:hypothetical protein
MIAVQMIDSTTARAVDVEAFARDIRPEEKGTHTITIECTKVFVPQIVKFIFTPVSSGGESLNARLRIFASYFLGPVKQDGFPLEKCEHVKDIAMKLKSPPPVCLKQLTKLLKAKIIADKATKSVRLYGKTSYGEFALVVFTCEGKIAKISVKSSVAELGNSLSNEIEMSLKAL